MITASFPWAGEPVPRKPARERRPCAQAGMRAGAGEVLQAFQRGQGGVLWVHQRPRKGICMSTHLLHPRQGEAFCTPTPAQ